LIKTPSEPNGFESHSIHKFLMGFSGKEVNMFDYRTKIALSGIIVGFGIIITIIVLIAFNKLLNDGDLTNGITIAVEIGIGLFIAMAVFLHSENQQNKTHELLSDVKSISDKLELQRIRMHETFRKAILDCLMEIWKKNKLILLNLRTHGYGEVVEPTNVKFLDDIVQTYKTQLLLYLQQLTILTVLSSSVLESELIASLLELRQEIEDNSIQTGMFRARNPWTAIFWRIDGFVKKYFPSDIGKFDIKDCRTLLEEKMKREIESGRS